MSATLPPSTTTFVPLRRREAMKPSVSLTIDGIASDNARLLGNLTITLPLAQSAFGQRDIALAFVSYAPGATNAQVQPAVNRVLATAFPQARSRTAAQFKSDQASQINTLLALIYVLAPRSEEPDAPRIERMHPREAMMELVQNTYMNWLLDQRQRAAEFGREGERREHVEDLGSACPHFERHRVVTLGIVEDHIADAPVPARQHLVGLTNSVSLHQIALACRSPAIFFSS